MLVHTVFLFGPIVRRNPYAYLNPSNKDQYRPILTHGCLNPTLCPWLPSSHCGNLEKAWFMCVCYVYVLNPRQYGNHEKATAMKPQ